MPTPAELALVDEIVRLAAAASSALPGESAPAFAHLRVRTRDRERDYLLGFRTVTADAVTVLHWQTAPLAEAFFACVDGSDYEFTVEGRVLEGRVLARTLLGFDTGTLVRIETAHTVFTRTDAHGAWTARDATLAAPLSPRSAEARARTASSIEVPLDETQLAAVQRPPGGAMLVLGEAGAGKTTVALHRLAHLARARAFERAVVLVPTEGLRRLGESLLERLGVRDRVEVALYDAWAGSLARRAFRGVPVRESQDAVPGVIRLKRHRALEVALDALAAREPASAGEDDPRAATTRRSRRVGRIDLLHLYGDDPLMAEVVRASDGAVSSRDARDVLLHTRVQFGDTTESEYAHVVSERLTTVDGRAIDAGTPTQDAGTVDAEDHAVLFALDRARSRARREPDPELPARYDCVVLDEAQEFAPLELALIGRALRTRGTLIVAGDAGQQVDPTACFVDWSVTMRDLGIDGHHLTRLETLYRSPAEVTALARRVLDPHDPRAAEARFGGPVTRLVAANECHLVAHLVETLRASIGEDPRASAAVIARTPDAARRLARLLGRGLDVRLALDGAFRFGPGVNVTCVQEVKGLEFDHVIVPDANPVAYPEAGESRRALYVALTRAVHHVLIATVGAVTPVLSGVQ